MSLVYDRLLSYLRQTLLTISVSRYELDLEIDFFLTQNTTLPPYTKNRFVFSTV